MIKKILVLAFVLLLAACENGTEQTNSPDAIQGSEEVENISESGDEKVEVTVLDYYDTLVIDNMFADDIGNQAWEDYKAISEDSTLTDMEVFDGAGNSMEDIQMKMGQIVNEDIEYESQTLPDDMNEILVYHYKGTVNDEEVDIATIYLHFIFDQLNYTAIVPGAYFITEDGVYDVVEDYNEVDTLSDLIAFDPKPNVFGISQYRTEGKTYQQVQLFAAPNSESESESNMINSLIFDGEEVLDELSIDFEYAEEVGYAYNGLETFESSYAHENNRPGEEASEAELADPTYYLANGYSNLDLTNIYDKAYDKFKDTVVLTGTIEDFHNEVEEEYIRLMDVKFAELEEDIEIYIDNNVSADDTEALNQTIENAQTYLESILVEANAKLDVANEQVESPNSDQTFDTLLSIQNYGTTYLLDIQTKELERYSGD